MAIHKNYPNYFIIFRWKLGKTLHRCLAYATLLKKIFLVTLLSNKSKKQPLRINTFGKYIYIYVYVCTHINLSKSIGGKKSGRYCSFSPPFFYD